MNATASKAASRQAILPVFTNAIYIGLPSALIFRESAGLSLRASLLGFERNLGGSHSAAVHSQPMTSPAIPDQALQQAATDRRLLAGVARGESAAFSALYDRLAGPLYTLCLRMTGEAHEAEDILQEVSLLIWRRAVSYDASKSTVFGWAVHLTRCKAIDYLRSRGRRLRVLAPERPLANMEDSQAIGSGVLEGAMAPDISAGDQADLKERATRVRHLLKLLPAEQLQAIELAFFSDLSHHEISARLGQPLGTIKARIRRGLLKLRDTLGTPS